MSVGSLSEALRRIIGGFKDPQTRQNLVPEMHWLGYFQQARQLWTSRQLEQSLPDILKSSLYRKFSKGSLLYEINQKADYGYFVLSGNVTLYSCRIEAEKMDWVKKNRRLGKDARQSEIMKLTGIRQEELLESLGKLFVDEDIQFVKYNKFHRVSPGEYFGFSEMVKVNTRPLTAIATEDSILIAIPKWVVDRYMLEYQKLKQTRYLEMLSTNMDPAILLEVRSMFGYLLPSIVFKKCLCDEVIYEEGDSIGQCYLITAGEFESYKFMELSYPEEYKKQELKSIKSKLVSVTINRLLPGQFIGEEELVVNQRQRNFSLKSISGESELLKIEASQFLRLLNERYDTLRFISRRAKEKLVVNQENYKEISSKITEGFQQQFKEYEEKKQDKMVQQVAGDDKITQEEIECLREAEPGIFYRDTYQKIQKMALFEKDENFRLFSEKKWEKAIRGSNTSPKLDRIHRPQLDASTQEKLLFSQRKVVNQAELMTNFLSKKDDQKQLADSFRGHRRTSSLSPQRTRDLGADRLRVDEKVHKRVLIQKGIFKRQIESEFRPLKVATAFQQNFSPVIESCILRKNQSINRIASDTKRKELIQTAYKSVVKRFQEKQYDSGQNESLRMFHSWTIKDLRKTFSSMSKFKTPSRDESREKKKRPSHNELINQFDCILAPSKLRKEGRVSYEFQQAAVDQQARQYLTAKVKKRLQLNRTTPKLVLLNHMMKPIPYNS